MKINHYIATLDACVLAPMPVADTLLRLAEEPAFFIPKWSQHILDEVKHTLTRFEYTQTQVNYRIERMTAAFPDAMTIGYEDLIDAMRNDPKDRHVLACAVRSGSHAIVTSNKKHFPSEATAPYGLECMSPDEFLVHQYHLDPDGFISVIVSQASKIKQNPSELMARLQKHVPQLVSLIKI